MKKTILFILALVVVSPLTSIYSAMDSANGESGIKQEGDNTLTQARKTEGWQLLFDGETLDGWSIKSGFAEYKVDKGAIVGTTTKGSPNTFLCSEEEFSDFELIFHVKFDEKFFNSGVQIRSKLRGEKYGGRVYGPQVEIEKSPGQSGFIYGEAAGGWQSPEPLSEDKSVNPHNHFLNGEWNHYRIVAEGRRIRTWINGNPVADLVYDASRYMDNSEGFISLQVHGVGNKADPMTVRWKNIYIKPLKVSSQTSEQKGSDFLFNGLDFTGWKFHLGKEGADNNGSFTVANEIMSTAGNPRGYIYTERSFSNYIIKYDWKFQRPDDLKIDSMFKGNSGCLVHVGKKNALNLWPLCIEVQGQHRRAGLILPIPRDVKCKHSFDLGAYKHAINPVGQWSTMVIEVNGGNMRIKVNGIDVSTVEDCELTSGQIGLQSEGAPLKWKNIRILERH